MCKMTLSLCGRQLTQSLNPEWPTRLCSFHQQSHKLPLPSIDSCLKTISINKTYELGREWVHVMTDCLRDPEKGRCVPVPTGPESSFQISNSCRISGDFLRGANWNGLFSTQDTSYVFPISSCWCFFFVFLIPLHKRHVLVWKYGLLVLLNRLFI